jgi:hypothetical protein
LFAWLVGKKQEGFFMPRKEFKARLKNDVSEPGFKLPLNMRVEGEDASGRPFHESTKLSYISSSGSTFVLETKVNPGSDLRLMIDLPEQLADDKNLKLIIKGKVIFIEKIKEKESGQRISLHFDNKYIIEEKED